MKYLITGGCGFIGSNLVDFLVEKKHKVVVIDNESSEAVYKNPKAKYYNFCITDIKNTNKIYKNVDCIFHMAAKARIQDCIKDPLETIKTNYEGTLAVLECMKNNKVRRMIFSSTSSIYGNGKSPQKEDDESNCLNHYSLSKLGAEQLCKLYVQMHNLDIAILRYFNIFGNRESKTGPYASVLGIFKRQKNKNIPLTVVGDGSQKRDFTSVEDVVSANILACNYKEKIKSEIFNVGSGENYSVLEIANLISDKIKFLPKRIGESKETLANIKKISKKLGYKPSNTVIDYVKKTI
jgi:UDP-glucose 4-epimerase